MAVNAGLQTVPAERDAVAEAKQRAKKANRAAPPSLMLIALVMVVAALLPTAAAATAHHADHNPSRIYDSFAISSDRQDNLRTRNVWLAEQRSPSRQDFLLRRKGRFSIKRLLALKEAVLGTVP